MKILDNQVNDESLANFGLEIVNLIVNKKYVEVAEQYGYALSFDKKPADVIKADINECLNQAGNNSKLVSTSNPIIEVKYFEKNETNLVALVECTLLIENGVGEILVELIITGNGVDKHITLEEISYAA